MIGKTVSHYKIIEKIGGGGMGIVYKAEDLKLGRSVALKFLPPELGQEEKRRLRFVQEAKAASSLDHPNLCTIYEIDQTPDGQMFISMALYEGETLKTKILSGSLQTRNALEIAAQIADGLAIAHQNGILHRDIKPANVIVTKSELVKILDFGLAKLSGAAQITEAETAVGTISYMSPEQALGKPLDQRTDIWSWGVVLYEMLTGQLPIRAENPIQMLHALYLPEPVDLSNCLLPPELVEVLRRALSKDPAKRYASIVDAGRDVRGLKVTSHSLSITTAVAKNLAETTVLESGLRVSSKKAEKKPLTFVICGLTGYFDLLEQLPFDDVNRFLSQFQKSTETLAERHHGLLNQFDPERIVVLFGIPTAQENDFVSAVHFAFDVQSAVIELCKELGESFEQLISLRCGIHSGLVLIQPSMHGKNKYEITGLPFQIALTLASNAKPSEVVIAQESRRLTRNLFTTESRDAIPIPGVAISSNAYSLLSQSDSSAETFLAPYTGRASELQVLKESWQKAVRGEGEFVTVIGEAGVGKSRLFSEFKNTIDTKIRFLHAHCHPYGASIPYAPFRELLDKALELHSNSTADEVIAKIFDVDPLLQDFTPLYLHLLSLHSERFPFPKHLEGENLRLALLDALTAFVLVNTRVPLLLLFEDWHWADEASQNALKPVLEMVPEQRALILVNSRPDSAIDWTGIRHHKQIYLEPLEVSASTQLMQALLQSGQVGDQLAQLIFDRAGGNPFFLEEICLSLKEEGKITIENGTAMLAGSADTLRLPETIQALILSRLDRMDDQSRQVLQAASVIGREFARPVLQRLKRNDENLAICMSSLKRLGLIQQIQVLPEATYKFRHALTQEVAYESLLAHEKKQLHQEVAEAIEEFYKDRLEEYLDLLAEHFSRAGNWRKAVEYGMQASKKAVALGQFSEAFQTLKKTEEWLLKLPSDETRQGMEIDLMLQEERLCETLGIRERQEQILRDLLIALQKTGDKVRQMEVYRRQGELLTLLARFKDAETALDQSLTLSKALNDRSGERNALRSIGFMRWHQGRNEEAVSNNQKALMIDREQGDFEAIATDLTNLGSVLRNKGDHTEALACLQEALKLYEEINDPVKNAAALHLMGNVHRELGNSEEAMHFLQAAMAVSTRYRLVIMQSFHLTSLANMCWQQGKMEECLDLQKRAVEINKKSRYADGLANSLRLLGETLQNMGRPSEAIPPYEEAAALFARLKDHRNEAGLLNKIAQIHEEREAWSEALAALTQLKNFYISMQNSKEIVDVAERMAAVCRKQGNLEMSIAYYREAIGALELLGEFPSIAAILNSIAIVEWKSAKYAEALQDYQRALEIFQDHGDRVHSGLILNSIGLTFKSMGRYSDALSVLIEALRTNRETGQRKLEGHSVAAIADVHNELGDIDAALRHYQDALVIKRETGDAKGEAWMLYHLARLQDRMGPAGLEEDYRIEAEKLVADIDDQKLKQAWKELQRNFKSKQGGDHA